MEFLLERIRDTDRKCKKFIFRGAKGTGCETAGLKKVPGGEKTCDFNHREGGTFLRG